MCEKGLIWFLECLTNIFETDYFEKELLIKNGKSSMKVYKWIFFLGFLNFFLLNKKKPQRCRRFLSRDCSCGFGNFFWKENLGLCKVHPSTNWFGFYQAWHCLRWKLCLTSAHIENHIFFWGQYGSVVLYNKSPHFYKKFTQNFQ